MSLVSFMARIGKAAEISIRGDMLQLLPPIDRPGIKFTEFVKSCNALGTTRRTAARFLQASPDVVKKGEYYWRERNATAPKGGDFKEMVEGGFAVAFHRYSRLLEKILAVRDARKARRLMDQFFSSYFFPELEYLAMNVWRHRSKVHPEELENYILRLTPSRTARTIALEHGIKDEW